MKRRKPKMVPMRGWTRTLSTGSTATLCFSEADPDDGIQLRFVKGRKKTNIGLSIEAMEAVAALWQSFLDLRAAETGLKELASQIQMRIHFHGPSSPLGYAGIPPVLDPEEHWRQKFYSITNQCRLVPRPDSGGSTR